MALRVTVSGLGDLQTWLVKTAKGLEKVPERFSERADVKNSLRSIAQKSLAEAGINRPEKHGAIEAMKAESTDDKKGIVVFQEVNELNEPKAARVPITDSYLLFFLTDYAKFFFNRKGLSEQPPKDFLKLWPERMKPVVVEAFEDEVRKVLQQP